MRTILFVMAATYREYQEYLRDESLTQRDAVFVDHPYKMMGCRGHGFVTIGKFWEQNPHAGDIVKEARYRILPYEKKKD